MRLIFILLAALLLSGCSYQQMLERFAAPEDRALATAAIDELRTGQDGAFEARLSPQIRGQVPPLLPRMRAALPPRPDLRLKLVGASSNTTAAASGASFRQSYLSYQAGHDRQFVLIRIGIARSGKDVAITDFYINPLKGAVDELNSFNLKNASAAHYVVLILAIGVVVISIAGLVKLWLRPGYRRRWLWTIGCLFGVTQIMFDWSTGAFAFRPIAIQLLSASVVRAGPFAPWQIGISIPVVALYILLRRQPEPPVVEPEAATFE